jgi:hypothetical protein
MLTASDNFPGKSSCGDLDFDLEKFFLSSLSFLRRPRLGPRLTQLSSLFFFLAAAATLVTGAAFAALAQPIRTAAFRGGRVRGWKQDMVKSLTLSLWHNRSTNTDNNTARKKKTETLLETSPLYLRPGDWGGSRRPAATVAAAAGGRARGARGPIHPRMRSREGNGLWRRYIPVRISPRTEAIASENRHRRKKAYLASVAEEAGFLKLTFTIASCKVFVDDYENAVFLFSEEKVEVLFSRMETSLLQLTFLIGTFCPEKESLNC